MISNWQYVSVPQGIDLTVPLMPLRNQGDASRYGVDSAWQYEVLSAWYAIAGGNPSQNVVMPIRPAAQFTNGIRSLASSIKYASPCFTDTVPSSAFRTEPNYFVTFGNVPADVAVKDPVQATDVSSIFAWMDDVRYVRKSFTAQVPSSLTYTTTHGEDGTGSWSSLVAPSGTCIRKWNWYYYDYSGGSWEHLSGGAWRLDVVSGGNVTATWSGRNAAMFSGVTAFLKVRDGGNYGNTIYVPLSSVSFAQASNSISITASLNANDSAAALSALGIVEVPYKGNSEGYDTKTIYAETGSDNLICYFELAQDYRCPDALSA